MSDPPRQFEPPPPPALGETDRRELSRIARASLLCWLEGREESSIPVPSSGVLAEPHGVFITLRGDGKLRGCIGSARPDSPLARGVAHFTRAAASRDPRFPPLRAEELASLEVEISVLGPLTRLPGSPGEAAQWLRPGVHGVVLTLDRSRGLLLPQVALRHDLDAEALLDGVAEKANLEPGAWRKPEACLEIFTVASFSVTSLSPTPPPRSPLSSPEDLASPEDPVSPEDRMPSASSP